MTTEAMLKGAGFALECTGGNNYAHTKALPDGRYIYVGAAIDGEPIFAPVETEDEQVCVEVEQPDADPEQRFFPSLDGALGWVRLIEEEANHRREMLLEAGYASEAEAEEDAEHLRSCREPPVDPEAQ